MARIAGVTREETRARVLEAAAKVFAEVGYDGAKMRQLAHTAGVNVATIAYHFGDKRGLYDAVVDQMYEGLRGFSDQLELTPGGDPVGSLVAQAWRFVNEHRDALRVVHSRLVRHGEADPEVGEEWLGQRVDVYAGKLAALVGIPLEQARMALLSAQYLLARYALSNAAERCRITQVDDPVVADERIVSHLTEVARRLLAP